jgi:hypothetical protein
MSSQAPGSVFPTRHGAGRIKSHPARTRFLDDVLDAVAIPTMEQGWRGPRITNKGYAITWGIPPASTLERTSVKLRRHPQELVLHLLVEGCGEEGNHRVVEAAREHHAQTLQGLVPSDAELRWHRGHRSSDSVHIAIPGQSWDGDPQKAPETVIGLLEALHPVVLDRRLVDAGQHRG